MTMFDPITHRYVQVCMACGCIARGGWCDECIVIERRRLAELERAPFGESVRVDRPWIENVRTIEAGKRDENRSVGTRLRDAEIMADGMNG